MGEMESDSGVGHVDDVWDAFVIFLLVVWMLLPFNWLTLFGSCCFHEIGGHGKAQ